MAEILSGDITDKVSFNFNDGECLPLTKCACGKEFDLWTFSIGISPEYPTECPGCGRKLWFSTSIQVYEVIDA